MKGISELETRRAVQERYSKLANESSCCGGDCCETGGGCGDSSTSLVNIGENVPIEASSINAGCGSPLSLITPKHGGIILDLGSGGGIDVFRASRLVGPDGRVIGVDSTFEMVSRARATREKYIERYENTEFRLGEIEHLPVESESVDYVISNCVINLSPDKEQVLREAFRVLKRGGILAIADVTVEGEVPEEKRKDMRQWSSCMSGALSHSEYKRLLASAGFEELELEQLPETVSSDPAPEKAFEMLSSHIKARKPLV